MFRTIVLGTDGSAASEVAASVALRLAGEQHAQLTVVYVIDPHPYLGIGDTNPMGLQAYLAAAREHAALAHGRVLDLATRTPAVDVRTCLLDGVRAVHGILGIVRQQHADLVVVGAHGRHGVDRLLLGSVSARLLRLSPVPVLVVPAPPTRATGPIGATAPAATAPRA